MKTLPLIAVLTALSALLTPTALAQSADAAPEPPLQRSITLTVYGDDDCPKAQGDDIIVCARRPESERYRIPKQIRERAAPPGATGWASQVATMEETQHNDLPVSGCSVLSTSAAGCLAKALRQWRAERRMAKSEDQP